MKYERTGKQNITVIIAILFFVAVIVAMMNNNVIYAEENQNEDIFEICEEYTANRELQDGSGNDITQYEAYIDESTEAEIV